MQLGGMAKLLVEGADIAWEVKCRQEDMMQRAVDNERREIDDARRAVDEKAEQLKAISCVSCGGAISWPPHSSFRWTSRTIKPGRPAQNEV
mmetsp:Transcript_10698/g.43281  ORF Transcript_10698/g.43281 Transcript_10698/m.43281 type:complete len:91 (-) Transcript_10698:874-1146(-)